MFQAEDSDPMWYALVQEEQLGPMPEAELLELRGIGVVAADTLVWNESLPDWVPFSEVPELAGRAASLEEEGDEDEEEDGATMMIAEGENWAALLGGLPAPPPRSGVQVVRSQPLPEPRSSLDDSGPRDVATVDRSFPSAGGGLLDPPSFAGPSVDEPGDLFDVPAPLIAELEPAEMSIDERFPDAPLPAVEEPASGFELPAFGDAPVSMEQQDWAPLPTAASAGGGGNRLLLVGIVVLALGGAAAGGAIWFLQRAPVDDGAATAPPSELEPVAAQIGGLPDAAPPPDAAPQREDASPAQDAMVFALLDIPEETAPESAAPKTSAPASAAPETSAPAAPKSRAPRTAAPRSPKTAAPRTSRPRSPASRSPRTTARPPKPSGDKPVRLSREDMLKVLKANAPRLKVCAALDEKAKGTFSVAVTIKRSGAVGTARVATARLRGSPAAKCIEAQVKGYKFKAFTGDPMRLQIPFRI